MKKKNCFLLSIFLFLSIAFIPASLIAAESSFFRHEDCR
jgi:hypothetical protein